MILKNRFSIVFLLSIFTFISCSKDSDNPERTEITVTTSGFTANMDENPENGQVIGTIQGSTNEGSVSFSITEQNPAGAFSIDATSGELKVADASLFKFESNPVITGTVKVANGAVFKNALVTLNLNDLNGEKIFDGNVQIETQQEVIDFGSQNYTRVTGDFIIGDINLNTQSTITDLSPLNALKTVDLNLFVNRNIYLTSLDGLENLSFVGKSVLIRYNDLLENIEALYNITKINKSLEVSKNPNLLHLKGLENVISVRGEVILHDNDSMISLEGLNGLSFTNSKVSIQYNEVLENLDALSNLTTINKDYYCCGGLFIKFNQSLTNINGLSNLSHVEDNLDLIRNPLLSDFCGLQSLFLDNGLAGEYNAFENAYDPTKQDIIDGNCSL